MNESGWALNDLADGRVPKVDAVVEAVAHAFRLTPAEIMCVSRSQEYVLPRHVAAYLARELCMRSWPELGRELHRDHTTLMASYQKIAARVATDPRIATVVARLRAELTREVSEAAE